jgi:hypothetical protein
MQAKCHSQMFEKAVELGWFVIEGFAEFVVFAEISIVP